MCVSHWFVLVSLKVYVYCQFLPLPFCLFVAQASILGNNFSGSKDACRVSLSYPASCFHAIC